MLEALKFSFSTCWVVSFGGCWLCGVFGLFVCVVWFIWLVFFFPFRLHWYFAVIQLLSLEVDEWIIGMTKQGTDPLDLMRTGVVMCLSSEM